MASLEKGKKDDFDSLFEGMLLFNPCQIAEADDDEDDNQSQALLTDAADGTAESAGADADADASPPGPPSSSSSALASQPLDENLFSDLTLVTSLQTTLADPLQPPLSSDSDPPSSSTIIVANTPSTTVSLSRQLSSASTRKKKRATGLRIGYGRDAPPISDDHPFPPHPPPLLPHASSPQSIELSLPSPLPSFAEIIPGKDDDDDDDEAEAATASCLTPDSLIQPHSQPASHPSFTTFTVEDDLANKSLSSSVSSSTENAALRDDVNSVSDEGANNGGAIELKFEQVRAHIADKLSHALELVDSVSAERKISTNRRREAAENVSMASTKYKVLEKQLEEACEAEDFETAERVSESLASAEKDKECLAIALRDAESDHDAVEFKMQEVLEWQIQAEEECASLLEQFAMGAANNADLVLKNLEVMSAKEMDKWHSPTEALEVKKMELEIESHLINETRSMLNDSIAHSVENDRRERELLNNKKEMLTGELEILLALVKEKEAEIVENNCSIEMVEKKIANMVSSFQEVQSSMDAEYENLQSNLSQMVLDNEALARKKEEIDDLLSKEAERGAKLRELAHTSADEADVYHEVVGLRKSLLPFILKSREDKVRLAKTEEKLYEDVQMLRQEISSVRASLQELSSTKSCMQQEIESLKQRVVFIDKRVPELEADKRVAAAVRNFKDVARIAAEAKALTVEKEVVHIKLGDSVLELGKVEEEIGDAVNRLQEIEDQIPSKEKEAAMSRFHRLLLIAGAATSERSAALEFGDIAEADILLAEAESADSEARKLQLVYNFKEEKLTTLPKHFISMKLVSKLGGKQLSELAASAHVAF